MGFLNPLVWISAAILAAISKNQNKVISLKMFMYGGNGDTMNALQMPHGWIASRSNNTTPIIPSLSSWNSNWRKILARTFHKLIAGMSRVLRAVSAATIQFQLRGLSD